MAEIRIQNVAKRFGEYQALHDINMTIADHRPLAHGAHDTRRAGGHRPPSRLSLD